MKERRYVLVAWIVAVVVTILAAKYSDVIWGRR